MTLREALSTAIQTLLQAFPPDYQAHLVTGGAVAIAAVVVLAAAALVIGWRRA